jgi:hypothetical protein
MIKERKETSLEFQNLKNVENQLRKMTCDQDESAQKDDDQTNIYQKREQ